jgi:hypothetical protein
LNQLVREVVRHKIKIKIGFLFISSPNNHYQVVFKIEPAGSTSGSKILNPEKVLYIIHIDDQALGALFSELGRT